MTQFYLLLPDKPLLRLPRSVLEQLAEQKAAIPDCAGQKVRVAEVATIDDENRVPQEVHRIVGWYLEFDKDGMLAKDIRQEWIKDVYERLAAGLTNSGLSQALGMKEEKVVSLDNRARMKERDAQTRWKPTPEERSMLVTASLGHPRSIRNIKSVKIKQPPGPEVTWKTTKAFDKLKESIFDQRTATYMLDESELLGLSQLIDEHLKDAPEQTHGWRGAQGDVADMIKVKEAHRTGSGSWYAVVDVMRWKSHIGEQVKEASEFHPTRQAAAEAAQRLLREFAQYMTGDTTIEARIVSELEWEGECLREAT